MVFRFPLALRKRNIQSEILLLSHLPRKYAFVFNDNGVPHIDAEPGIPLRPQRLAEVLDQVLRGLHAAREPDQVRRNRRVRALDRAVRQMPAPGARIKPGEICQIEFQ